MSFFAVLEKLVSCDLKSTGKAVGCQLEVVTREREQKSTKWQAVKWKVSRSSAGTTSSFFKLPLSRQQGQHFESTCSIT